MILRFPAAVNDNSTKTTVSKERQLVFSSTCWQAVRWENANLRAEYWMTILKVALFAHIDWTVWQHVFSKKTTGVRQLTIVSLFSFGNEIFFESTSWEKHLTIVAKRRISCDNLVRSWSTASFSSAFADYLRSNSVVRVSRHRESVVPMSLRKCSNYFPVFDGN